RSSGACPRPARGKPGRRPFKKTSSAHPGAAETGLRPKALPGSRIPPTIKQQPPPFRLTNQRTMEKRDQPLPERGPAGECGGLAGPGGALLAAHLSLAPRPDPSPPDRRGPDPGGLPQGLEGAALLPGRL